MREPPSTDPRNTVGWDKYYGHGIVNAGSAYELLLAKGCEGAGGAYPDIDSNQTLSDMALGGSQQKNLGGCSSDEQCDSGNVCLGEFRCNVVENT